MLNNNFIVYIIVLLSILFWSIYFRIDQNKILFAFKLKCNITDVDYILFTVIIITRSKIFQMAFYMEMSSKLTANPQPLNWCTLLDYLLQYTVIQFNFITICPHMGIEPTPPILKALLEQREGQILFIPCYNK